MSCRSMQDIFFMALQKNFILSINAFSDEGTLIFY